MAYVTSATTKGGRNGRAMLDNGALALAMAAAEGNRAAPATGTIPSNCSRSVIRPVTARPSC